MSESDSDQAQDRAAAILLALAAVIGIGLGARATLLSSDASNDWQAAVRGEIKRAAAAVEDVRYVYEDEAPIAFTVVEARLRAEQARRAAAGATGLTRKALLVEAETLSAYATQLAKDIPKGLAGPRYRTAKGGFDAAKRLADERAKSPDLVRIDPDASQHAGDRLGRQSLLEMLGTIPAGLAFLLAAASEAFRRPRTLLLALATLALVGAVIVGIAVEAVYA